MKDLMAATKQSQMESKAEKNKQPKRTNDANMKMRKYSNNQGSRKNVVN